MESVLSLAASGLETGSSLIGAVATNLANVDTPGYGARQAVATSEPDVLVRPKGAPDGTRVIGPGLAYTQGVILGQDIPTFGQGVTASSVPTNLAVAGSGFFMVTNGGGQIGYTRAGQFVLNKTGALVLPNGMRLYPPVTLPAGASYRVEENGQIYAEVGGVRRYLGQIKIALFPNPSGLVAVGGNVYSPSAASGRAVVVTPGQKGAGTIAAGSLNTSNVSLAQAFGSLVGIETMYQMNAKVLTIAQGLDQAIATV